MKKLFLIITAALIFSATAQAESVAKAVHPAVYPAVHKVDCTPWQYLDYNFYADFLRSSTDQADNSVMSNASSAGKYDYLGNTYGENVPVIEPGKGLLTYGEYTNLLTYSEDISNAAWVASALTTITATTFKASAQYDQIYQTVSTTEGHLYTLSFIASTQGQKENYKFFHFNSATGTISDLTLSSAPTRYSVTVLGKSGDGLVLFGFHDRNTSNWATVTITDFQVTESAYELPYVKTTSATVTVPKSSADADEGSKYAIGAGSKLKTALYGTDGSDAQGRMIVKWQPAFDAADVSTDVNIITANDDATSFLFWDKSENKLSLYDGTNTATVACTPVSGTLYTIIADYDGTTGMQLTLDSSAGSVATFAGGFPCTADNLSFGWNEATPQYVGSLKFEKEPSW